MNYKLFDSPIGLYRSVPKEVRQNLEFRKTIHTVLEKDKKLQQLFMQMLLVEPKLWFDLVQWTKNPRLPAGERNRPFILRPKQEVAVDLLNDCIDNQHDIGINKSRDEGATEIVCKLFALKVLIPQSYFIIGSRNKDLVDSLGDPFTLFAKIDVALDVIPPWMKILVDYSPSADRKDMQLSLPGLGSVVRGETTNESFSAGRRATAILLDEFGRVEPKVAESIEGSVHDVSGCVIYGSTHWYGSQHPFAKALRKETTKVVNLLWYDNPEKRAGLYKTPDYDVVEIVDKDYYLKKYPEIFGKRKEWTFKLSDLEKDLLSTGFAGSSPKFVADKCELLPKGADCRSPWHDFEVERREGNVRDIASNIWGSPIGAQDSVFNFITLDRIESSSLNTCSFLGDIWFNRAEDGHIVGSKLGLGGKGRFKWWGVIKDGKPDLTHNYVVGCDPALGTGASNSVAAVLDVHTHEIVGLWADPNTPYELFADTVVALAHCLNEAFIIFENNGGHGVNFGRRLLKDHYNRIYTQRTEAAKTKKVQNTWGWNSNPNTKADLLGELGIALSEGLKTSPTYISCIIHDKDILDELRGYVFFENGDIGASEEQDLTSGARKRHGDRVIAVGLCVLGSKYQNRQAPVQKIQYADDTFEQRKETIEKSRKVERQCQRRFWYN
jgi:hypothetical protein